MKHDLNYDGTGFVLMNIIIIQLDILIDERE